MSARTMPAPVDDDQVLEQLEAAFLLIPAFCPSPSEIDLAEIARAGHRSGPPRSGLPDHP